MVSVDKAIHITYLKYRKCRRRNFSSRTRASLRLLAIAHKFAIITA